MPPIINAQGISKAFGATTLFQNVSFTVSEGDRIGVIGPNGSGKSTLLRILAGQLEADRGDVAVRRLTRLSYVEQESRFEPGETVRSVLQKTLQRIGVAEPDHEARIGETLGRAGFVDFSAEAASLSGGWQKRLAIAEGLVQHPDILLLDEPTNHLDIAGIEWLEELLARGEFACVTISHDRYFLENVANEVAELNRAYPDGLLRIKGNYSQFLEKKEEYLHAQAKHQDALENRVRTEIEWLRRGPKARTTKSKARIDKAGELIGELADLKTRSRKETAQIDFSATDRQTKRLVELEGLSYTVPGRQLFNKINFTIANGMRVGLVGPNGSGKTTLLRLLQGELAPDAGTIRRALALQIVCFDQTRKLDEDVALRRALAPDSDAVVYQDRVIHVASWASRFLFTSEQLNQPVGRLSGGERARLLVAKLMLQPADVLLLDEPTNDLDIPTLEILEESLLEYRGALVLVTHDRYMLDRVSTTVLGLDGNGGAEQFADYSQWESWLAENQSIKALAKEDKTRSAERSAPKKKLSYLEAREFATIEQRIAEAEELLQAKSAALNDPAIASDASRILAAQAELDTVQQTVNQLYDRWHLLEEKAGV